MIRQLILFVLLTLCVGGCRSRDSLAIKEGSKSVIARGQQILFVAHPTAKYVDMQFEGYEKQDNNYLLTFDIEYRGLIFNKNSQFLKLLVTVDKNGTLKDYNWGRDTGSVPPGTVTQALGSTLTEALGNKLRR